MPIRIIEKGHPLDDAWILIHLTYDSIIKCEESTFSKTGLPFQQYAVLRAIKYIPNTATTTAVANWLDRNPNSISMIIDRMKRDGLVKRKRDLKDRRASRLIITPKGEDLYKKATKPARELPHKMLSVLSRKELLTLTSLLEKVREETFEIRNIKDKVINVGLSNGQDLSR